MQSLAAEDPLLSFPDFPRERLALASPEEVQSLVLDYIAEHRASVRSTREEIHSDPDFVYKLDNLLRASMEAQGIQPGSIYERIIRDHMAQARLEALLEGVALAVITLALTIATFGGGTIGVVAGVAAVGLSAFQAVDAFNTYVRESNAEDAQLLSEDPSIGWLVLAVVGAAADLGAAVAAVRALRPAAQALNQTGDVLAFRQALSELRGVDARILRAVEHGADAQAAIAQQWRAIAAIGHRANDILGVVAESGYRLMVMAWHGAKRGLVRFDQFLAELHRAQLIARIEDLTPEELHALRGPFDEGLRRALDGFLDPAALDDEARAALTPAEIDDAAAFGRFIGLSDDEVAEVLGTQARVSREADPSALSPEALRGAMRERASGTADETVADVGRLPESGARTVRLAEQSYEIGVAEGRRFLEAQGFTQWDQWINPFEFNGRYGQGIDDVFVDRSGQLWIVEYKGGTAELGAGQMARTWVEQNIQRMEDAQYHFVVNRLQQELRAGRLRGVVVSTPEGEPARIAATFHY